MEIDFCDGEEQWWLTETNGPRGYQTYQVPAPDRVVDLMPNEMRRGEMGEKVK